MKNYTLDDIETLRSKTGISYEEAVGLLEKYDGDIARALIELEKRGRLGKGVLGGVRLDGNVAQTLAGWWKKGCDTRVIVERDGRRLLDLSVLFMIFAALLGWRLMLASAALALILGCRVRLRRAEPEEPVVAASQSEAGESPEAGGQAEDRNDEDGFHTITIE